MEQRSTVSKIVQRYMALRGMSRLQLGAHLSSSRNRSKAFRRLDELMEEKRVVPDFVREVGTILKVPAEEIESAIEEHARQPFGKFSRADRDEYLNAIRRQCPCVKVVFCDGFVDSVAKAMFARYRGTKILPKTLIKLPIDEQIFHAHATAAKLAEHLPEEHVDYFEYWQTPDKVFSLKGAKTPGDVGDSFD